MRFDDRLKTVLAQPAPSAHDRAIRWRQLVELAARAPPDGDRDLFAQAIRTIREDCNSVDERVRAAAALAVAPLPLRAELVASFAADRLAIAAPVLASARLTASEWQSVAAAASDECRSFIAVMRSEPPPPAGATAELPRDGAIPSIGDVVARIQRLRQSREKTAGDPDNAGEQPRLFRWECNESGEIDWVEGAPRGALVGQSIAGSSGSPGVDRTVERAFASRAPFHDGLLELPSDIPAGGTWKISGIPAFERSNGRFAGYRGVAERASQTALSKGLPADGDSLRELAHEIKTPLNAIVGFAEIIAGEYLGPAGSRYRERAQEIVAQARLLLSAIDDLDFAARIHSSAGEDCVTDVGALIERLAHSIREVAAAGNVEVDASRSVGGLMAAIEPDIAERLVLRMCSAVIARAAEGEHLQLSVDRGSEFCTVTITRPRALEGLSEEELFGSASNGMSPTFPLRLARGLAQAAGAGLIAGEQGISLLLRRS